MNCTPIECAVATRFAMLGMLPDGDGAERRPVYMHWSQEFGVAWDQSDRRAVLVDENMDRMTGTTDLPLGLAMHLCARACEPGRSDPAAYIVDAWRVEMKRNR